ncbi:MAG: hypothetical protein WCJ30_15170 [Deltaproteobacteria bacterium]
MSTERHLVLPWVEQTATEVLEKIPLAALEKLSPPLDALMPHCVPSPYAEAEVMTCILRSLSSSSSGPFVDVIPKETLRQSFQRWQTLLKTVLLGRVAIEQVALRAPDGDRVSFARALSRSRSSRPFQGVLRSFNSLVLPGRKSRLVGGLDEMTLVWSAPRLQDSEWGVLSNTVAGADENLAISLLFEWRRMLTEKALWQATGDTAPWMRGVDQMLEGRTATHTWAQLRPDVAMEGPVRLTFPRSNGDPLVMDIYLPVYRPGHGSQFQQLFRLKPIATDGGVNLAQDRSDGAPPLLGAFVQMTATRTPGVGQSSGDIAVGNELLAGLGSVAVRDLKLAGDRWWLQDREDGPGYKTAVFKPLLEKVINVYSTRLPLGESDIQGFPIFFPDALNRAFELLHPPDGSDGVEYATLRRDFASEVGQWPLPRYGRQLSADTLLPTNEDFVLALDRSHSAPCLVERLTVNGTLMEVGELRALGALIWEVFVGETKLKNAGSLGLQRGRESASVPLASQARESEPRLVFKEALLASVGSILVDQSNVAAGYRQSVQTRRATAQRFLTLWTSQPPSAALDVVLASLAARTFLEWAFKGSDLGDLVAWGKCPDPAIPLEVRLKVTGALALPLYFDVYAQQTAMHW